MSKSTFCKLFGLLLVAALIVSSNFVAGGFASERDGTSVEQSSAAISGIDRLGESVGTQNTAENMLFSWDPSAVDAFAEGDASIEVIVGLDNTSTSYSTISELIGRYGGAVTDTIAIGAKNAVVVNMPTSAASEFAGQVHASGAARYVEPNGQYQADSTVNDEYWSRQWGSQKIGVDYAWNSTVGDDSLLVAVIDSGIDYNHPDLAANYVPLGYDFINNDNDPLDDFGHGTHCAGVIAAVLNNSVGIAGMAQVKIMAEKGLSAQGSGPYTALANCIVHATDADADILSNSWGGSSYSQLITDAVNYATAHGVLVVAASGNGNTDQPTYPAYYENVIAVAATNTTDTRAWFSNYGSWVDVSAPGVEIYSTMPTYHVVMNDEPRFTMTYSYMNGTSMACPYAAGLAALIWSQYPNMTARFVRQQLESTCDDLGELGFDIYFGHGRINARNAIEQTPVTHDLIADSWVAPGFAMLDAPSVFNVSAVNGGLSNETDVTLSLLVNGTVVDSESYAAMNAYTNISAQLSWTPDAVGTYNVTFSVAPAAGEVDFANNVLSRNYTVVAPPNDEDWTLLATDPDEAGTGFSLKEAYSQMQSGVIFFKVGFYRPWSYASSDIDTGVMIDVDRSFRTGVHEGFYSGQADCIGSDYMILVGSEGSAIWRWDSTLLGFDINNPIDLLYLDAQNGSSTFVVGVSASDLHSDGVFDCSFNDITIVGNKGFWDWMPNSGYVPFVGQPAQKDLVVTVETPRMLEPKDSFVLTAKVFNFGQATESDVNLKLIVDERVVNITTFAALEKGAYGKATYSWHPNTEGHYNITAYATPVDGEVDAANNVRSRIVPVTEKIALISDNTELVGIASIVDSMDLNYDFYVNNSANSYTSNLTLLNQYTAVIYYNYARNITLAEQLALNAYLAVGGNLLVTGYDSLLYTDAKLADVVRALTYGDDNTQSDLYVTNPNHPVMNGPYGQFPQGYHITGLFRDNDAIEANTAGGAQTIAQLADGKDKIIVASSLPGKVVFWNGDGARDWNGNASCTAMLKNTLIWFVDTVAPVTTDDYDGSWYIADYTIHLEAADYFGVNQTYYRINNGDTMTVAADGQPRITVEGANNIVEYWSVDLAGNEEVHHFLTEVKLDKMGPTGTLRINSGAIYATSTAVTLSLTATDAVSGVYQVRYGNDGVWDTETWEAPAATKAWTLPDGDGEKTVYCQIKDNAGLPSVISSNIILHTTQPTGSININNQKTCTNQTSVNLTLGLLVDPEGVTMHFSNDNATWSNWETFATSKTWNIETGDGTKQVYVQFKDRAGLTTTYNGSIILDTTAPTANAGQSQTVTIGDSVTLNGEASTDSSGIVSYRWNLGDGTDKTGVSVTHTYAITGTYTATLIVEDLAGNTASTTVTIQVKDKPSPTSTPSPTTKPTATPTQSPTPTPSPTPTQETIQVTKADGSTIALAIQGNISASQITNAVISSNASSTTTTLSFTVTGQSGNTGFSNITIPKSAVPAGATPVIYVDNKKGESQGYCEDATNFYVWFTASFSTHDVSVVFTGVPLQPQNDYTVLLLSVLVVAVVVCVAVAVLLRKQRK